MRTLLRLGTAVLGIAASGLVGASAAAATEAQLTPTVEAWYQADPTCVVPTGCAGGSLPARSPYPAGTLHVGVVAGHENARSLLGFSLAAAPDQATLTVPLDTSSSDGSSSPETATVIVCLVTAPITAVEGSTAPPPKTDCNGAAKASYAAAPTPHLTADLTSLARRLPAAHGLALLPDATSASGSWQVVFSAHTRADAAKTAPAALRVELPDVQPTTTEPVGPEVTSQPPADLVPVTGGSGLVALPVVPQPLATAAPPPAVSEPQQPQAAPLPAAEGQTITVGYAYPGVWLLPLVFLLVVPLIARALTRDLSPTPPEPAEQAPDAP